MRRVLRRYASTMRRGTYCYIIPNTSNSLIYAFIGLNSSEGPCAVHFLFFHAEYFPIPPASFTVSMGSTFQKVKCLSPLHCDAYFSLLLQR